MLSTPPMVSVVMPAYNCEQFVGEAIAAVLGQSFSDFELIIINDGSTDNTRDVILSFKDPRIVFLENQVNLGLVRSLNKGLSSARGEYIVRTDADDVALDCLVHDLVQFLQDNKEYIVCGANMQLLGGEKIFEYPSHNEELRIHTLNACPFSHSTVAIRKSILDNFKIRYDEQVLDGEDHALWSELIPFGKFHNLSKVTLLYRVSAGQITNTKSYSKNYLKARELIFEKHARKLFMLEKEEEIKSYIALVTGNNISGVDDLRKIGELCQQLIINNRKGKIFDEKLLSKFIFIKWYWRCMGSYAFGKKVYNIYRTYQVKTRFISNMKANLTQLMKSIKS